MKTIKRTITFFRYLWRQFDELPNGIKLRINWRSAWRLAKIVHP